MRISDFLNDDASRSFKPQKVDRIVIDESCDCQLDESDDNQVVDEGSSSLQLASYVRRKYGGKIGCKKASMVINDPDTPKKLWRMAIWYRSLHCKGNRQIREDDPEDSPPDAALTIWDIDDTLFRTAARVIVNGPDGETKELSTSEYNAYKPKPGETLDFSQFDSAELFQATSSPIDKIWQTALDTLEKIGRRPGSKMVIITARRDLDNKHQFLDTFRQHGMDMSKVHVFRAGNLKDGTSAQRKQSIIRDLLHLGNYSEARMFDDHDDNLRAFLELKNEFPKIKFKAYPVSTQGQVGNPIVI